MKNVAFITGASSGLGKEFAKIHASQGGDVIVVARREERLNTLKKEIEDTYGTNVMVIAKDLTSPSAPKEIYEQVNKAGIQVNYLINNAGFGGQGKFHERPWEQDLTMIHLNIVALTALTRFFLSDFVKNNQGRILNVSSTASFMPGPLQAVYFATKAYVTFFSNAIAEELHDTNITVTNLMPGATETEFAQISGLKNTDLFLKAASAYSVAKDGYEAMLEGKLDVISGLTSSQKTMMKLLPFISKKTVLKRVRKIQELHA